MTSRGTTSRRQTPALLLLSVLALLLLLSSSSGRSFIPAPRQHSRSETGHQALLVSSLLAAPQVALADAAAAAEKVADVVETAGKAAVVEAAAAAADLPPWWSKFPEDSDEAVAPWYRIAPWYGAFLYIVLLVVQRLQFKYFNYVYVAFAILWIFPPFFLNLSYKFSPLYGLDDVLI